MIGNLLTLLTAAGMAIFALMVWRAGPQRMEAARVRVEDRAAARRRNVEHGDSMA